MRSDLKGIVLTIGILSLLLAQQVSSLEAKSGDGQPSVVPDFFLTPPTKNDSIWIFGAGSHDFGQNQSMENVLAATRFADQSACDEIISNVSYHHSFGTIGKAGNVFGYLGTKSGIDLVFFGLRDGGNDSISSTHGAYGGFSICKIVSRKIDPSGGRAYSLAGILRKDSTEFIDGVRGFSLQTLEQMQKMIGKGSAAH